MHNFTTLKSKQNWSLSNDYVSLLQCITKETSTCLTCISDNCIHVMLKDTSEAWHFSATVHRIKLGSQIFPLQLKYCLQVLRKSHLYYIGIDYSSMSASDCAWHKNICAACNSITSRVHNHLDNITNCLQAIHYAARLNWNSVMSSSRLVQSVLKTGCCEESSHIAPQVWVDHLARLACCMYQGEIFHLGASQDSTYRSEKVLPTLARRRRK